MPTNPRQLCDAYRKPTELTTRVFNNGSKPQYKIHQANTNFDVPTYPNVCLATSSNPGRAGLPLGWPAVAKFWPKQNQNANARESPGIDNSTGKLSKLTHQNFSPPRRKIVGRQLWEDSEKERNLQKISFRIKAALRLALLARLNVHWN